MVKTQDESLAADDMLKQLGYVLKLKGKYKLIYQKRAKRTGAVFELHFSKQLKGFYHTCDKKPWIVTPKLLRAILKKYAELGWKLYETNQE